MQKLKNYLLGSVRELHHVTWPTQKQAVRMTVIAIGFMIAMAIVIGAMDWIFSFLYTYLISIA